MEMGGEDSDSKLNQAVEREQKRNKLNSERNDRAIATTGLLFVIFLIPIAFGIFGFPFNLYLGVSVAIHEVGHLLFGILFGWDSVWAVAGGTIFEYANPLLAVLIFGRSRRGAALAMIFLACAGSAMPSTARYMESAEYPYGTSYFGNIAGKPNDVNSYSHDWSRMFTEWGMLGSEFEMAAYVRRIGEAFVLAGVVGSAVGFWFLLNYSPAGFPELLLVGGIPSALYFGVRGEPVQLAVCGGIVFLSISWYALMRVEEKMRRKLNVGKKEGKK